MTTKPEPLDPGAVRCRVDHLNVQFAVIAGLSRLLRDAQNADTVEAEGDAAEVIRTMTGPNAQGVLVEAIELLAYTGDRAAEELVGRLPPDA